MGELTIVFQGICTHFRREFHPTLPVPHRVVLINGENLAIRPPDFPEIQAHDGTITRPTNISGSNPTLPLQGVVLQVLDATGPAPTYDSAYHEIPNLTRLEDEESVTLGEPKEIVLFEEDHDWTVAHFDFTSGVFNAFSSGDGSATVAVTVTTSRAGDQIIEVTPYGGGTSQQFIYPDGTQVYVQNLEVSGPTSENDFLLHYLCAKHVPSVAELVIAGPFSAGCPGFQKDFGGPGCSDSNYP